MNKSHKKDNLSIKDKEIREDIKQLTIERLKALPQDLQISIGGKQGLSKEELTNSVLAGDETGQEMMDIQIEFLRDIAEGKMYKDE